MADAQRRPHDERLPTSTVAVEFVGVHKWFGALEVLKSINLQVRRNERVVVCGPSGSGKSTLIRCIIGLEEHQAGQIYVEGVEVGGHRRLADSRRWTVGMVFQQFNLFPHLTVLENCTLAPQKVKGLDRATSEKQAMELLARVHIADQAHKYPLQLSGGQQQRAAIARALCMQPQIMLFDEPTSSLDPEMVMEVLETMKDLALGGMTMICVTHEMGFAREVADRIVFMDQGEILEIAPPSQFFAASGHPRVRQFLAQVIR
ncbi:MAG: amino acid ABC transporter ATP-binding protein [Rhodospirillaceae bacterium]|nr:amino acid ABC transporter ATP-binding protein [Rhodospirillaceae bacterium]